MPTSLTRFEVVLPAPDPSTDGAVQQFLTSLKTLTNYVSYQAYFADGTFKEIIYGHLTNTQNATALGFLTTLNSALGSNVVCAIWQVTQEP